MKTQAMRSTSRTAVLKRRLRQSATMGQLNLFKFFKVTSSSPQVALPSPDGPLSRKVPSTAIAATSKEFEKIVIKGHWFPRACNIYTILVDTSYSCRP